MTLFVWPAARAGEALNGLALRAGLTQAQRPGGDGPAAEADVDAVGRYLDAAGATLGVDAEPVTMAYGDVEAQLARACPAIVRVPGGFVAALRARGGGLTVLQPDLTLRRVRVAEVAAALRAPCEKDVAGEIDRWLDRSDLPPRRRDRVRRAVLTRRLAIRPIDGVWMLRRAAWTPFGAELRGDGNLRRLVAVTAAYVLAYALTLASWWVLGKSALSGRPDAGWLAAWLLLAITIVPARLLSSVLQASLTASCGAALKRRLLAGALRFDPDQLRADGAGQLLGRALDSTLIDELALTGGVAASFAVVELAGAAVVIGLGAGGALHVGLLGVWTAAVAGLTALYYRRLVGWTGALLAMTNDTVEQMVGHRTRVAQLRPERWHETEDQALERYLELERRSDGAYGALLAAPRAWLLVAFIGLAPAFVGGSAPTALAVAIGGVVLAYQAFARLAQGVAELALARIAWRRLEPLYAAAATRPEPGMPELAVAAADEIGAAGVPVLDAQGVTFQHRGRAEPVLRGLSLVVKHGDRLLIEGPSGGGKSTLAALLAGARRPSDGLLFLGGLDAPSLGNDGWRRRVASAPQFHENHVVTETFAFNLLMGRRWPPREDDLREAEAICTELGLGPLLGRMPSGMMQMVGEGGWQLSHGERSRLYLARALLQGAEVVILDESFGALDPETLDQCVDCVYRRARTLVVIAHP